MKPIQTPQKAVQDIPDGSTIMVGGFMHCGHPFALIDALLLQGAKNLTLIVNDMGFPGKGIGKLLEAGRIRKIIATHIGLNPLVAEKWHAGEIEVELIPQGTLAERCRAQGAGLGGILTPTGMNTEVEDGKQKVLVDGKEYLLEKPLHADYAFVVADVADRFGNAIISKSRKNCNIVMAMAADNTILETRRIVDVGGIDPDMAHLCGVFVQSMTEANQC
ncbi:MAG: CoA transferase subunit A [Myxococcales bacterium]|nr:CoA transferase subunit A [Myxococcales bacterium]